MNFGNGHPAFIIPQMTNQHQPQNMDHARMNMVPHNLAFPPPPMHQQFPPNVKFVAGQPMQPNVHPQAQFYTDERGGQVFYPMPQAMFNRPPPPQHYMPNTPYIQQQSIDAVAEQLKNASQPAGPHPAMPPQNLQQMGHQMHPHLAHQAMMMPANQMHPHHYQRHYNQNSMSRGQTPTMTSHSGSKRSSPQNPHQTEAGSLSQQQQDDYTPPGTPQDLTPITEDQQQQYMASVGPANVDKNMEMMIGQFKDTHFDPRGYDPSIDVNKMEHPNENDVFNQTMEFVNPKFQNHDNKNWQHSVRAGEHYKNENSFGGNSNYDAYNGQNDKQMRNQQNRQGRNPPNRTFQDNRMQQRGVPPQRFQQPMQQGQQRQRQQGEPQWRNDMVQPFKAPEPVPEPTPERVTECSYCRMLGKPVEEYNNHIIRGLDGKAICPEIKKLQCPQCNATGENAHTEYFCPKIEKTGNDLIKTANDLRSYLERRKQPPPPLGQNHQQQQTRPQQYHQQQSYHSGGARRH